MHNFHHQGWLDLLDCLVYRGMPSNAARSSQAVSFNLEGLNQDQNKQTQAMLSLTAL